ncbi:related to Phosphatase DCR2 [Saccharomycodes ludwigii]|uniref:Related to Phosphatase DCR2 n=2 Tax=Saccharomycodes ludwigii TaxID=36035 RepID=A0A376B3P4_9ASCO|nr:related to Phosphatase DCR2 [Saccharomycodes ludwigii]
MANKDNEIPFTGIVDVLPYSALSPYKIKNMFTFIKDNITIENIKTKEFISDIDFLFGEDCIEPREDWKMDKSWKLNTVYYPTHITIKKINATYNHDPYSNFPAMQENLKLDENGNFKIVQFADLHFSVGYGSCRDEFPEQTSDCKADAKTLSFLEKILDIENPNMVIFTGDQIMGDRCRQDSISALLKVVSPVIKRKIPYAMVWGNHDDEGSLTRWELSEFVSSLPYSLFKFSPKDTANSDFGVGNYVIQIFTPINNNPAVTLYFLDSHKYSPNGKLFPGYAWIQEEQWKYIEQYYSRYIKPDEKKYSRIPLAMAFFHIPLPEYLNLNSIQHPGEQNKVVGSWKEGVTAPKYNSHGTNTLLDIGVDVVSVGHDHCNDYCLLDDSSQNDAHKNNNKLWLCYGGGSGEGGYAGYGGTERRIRVFEIDSVKNNIYTWKRLHNSPEEIFDKQVLVSDGVPS